MSGWIQAAMQQNTIPIRNSNLNIVSAYPPSGRNMVTFMTLKNSKLVMVTFVLNSILFPPQSRNFVKTLNYKTMIKLSIKTLILIIAFESHKKESSKRKACHKDLCIYGSMPCTTDFKFKNCQKLLAQI